MHRRERKICTASRTWRNFKQNQFCFSTASSNPPAALFFAYFFSRFAQNTPSHSSRIDCILFMKTSGSVGGKILKTHILDINLALWNINWRYLKAGELCVGLDDVSRKLRPLKRKLAGKAISYLPLTVFSLGCTDISKFSFLFIWHWWCMCVSMFFHPDDLDMLTYN